MKFHLLISLLIGFGASSTFAATNKVGNGGDVVTCPGQRPELLDFYEAALKNAASGSPYELAQKQIDKLKPAAADLHRQYSRRLAEMQNEIEFKDGIELADIDDSKHLFKPVAKKCKVEQIAIRRSEIIGDEKRFLFRNDFWKEMNAFNQAGLLTHEIIYEHLLKLDEENSIKARKLNSFIYKTDFSGAQFWALMKDLKLPIYP